ncbi:MAG: DUF4340 domain-containing protein [Oscillospiraceae bacterium]|nr:DUF4340 domain-containing protein [Oscillospiraceae bacterium]
MRKTRRQLLLLGGALAALLLLYAAVTLLRPAAQEEGAVPLNTFDANAINGISYLSGGQAVTLEKDEAGEWYAPADPQRVLRQGAVTAMATQSGRLKAADTVANTAGDGAAYGLDTPANVVTLRQGARQVTYLIGTKNPVTGDYYLQIQGQPQIYTVEAAFAEAFSGDIAWLTQPGAEEEA